MSLSYIPVNTYPCHDLRLRHFACACGQAFSRFPGAAELWRHRGAFRAPSRPTYADGMASRGFVTSLLRACSGTRMAALRRCGIKTRRKTNFFVASWRCVTQFSAPELYDLCERGHNSSKAYYLRL